MPASRKLSKTELARLSKLPRRPDFVLEGGKRTLGIFIRENKEYVQPQVVLWVDGKNGFVRGVNLIAPSQTKDNGVSEALETLVSAMTGPFMVPPTPTQIMPGRGKGKKGENPLKPQPGLPGKIVVNDEGLADAVREMLGSLNIAVEVSQEQPAFNEAFQAMSEAMGADETAEPPKPFSWDVDATLLPSLFNAVASYTRAAPWRYMGSDVPVMLKLGENNGPEAGVDSLFACIMGIGGEVTGIAFYYSMEAFERTLAAGQDLPEIDLDDPRIDQAIEAMRKGGAPVDNVPTEELRYMVAGILAQNLDDEGDEDDEGEGDFLEKVEDALVLYLEEVDEVDPTYLEWLDERRLKYPSKQAVPFFMRALKGGEVRQPNENEVKSLILALDALTQFCNKNQRTLEQGLLPEEGLNFTAQVRGAGEKGKTAAQIATVEVTFPPPGFDWDEDEEDWEDEFDEPDEPASPAALTTLYKFQVKLDWMKTVWRRIEMRGDQTLHELHEIIQEAFDWDDDHLYSFFMSGKAWDKTSEFASPYAAEEGDDTPSATKVRLENLNLKPKQKFLYLFDYGDELRHNVLVEAIVPGGVKQGEEYPRITEVHGEAPSQYGDEENEEDDDE